MAFGIVLAPNGHVPGSFPSSITGSYGGNGTFLAPHDPQFNQGGEAGYYYDTELGAVKPGFFTKLRMKRALKKLSLGQIPTDAELATVRGYMPVESGWVATADGRAIPAPWNTPNGFPSGGYPMPTSSLYGDVVDSNPVVPTYVGKQPPTVEEVMAALNSHNDRVFTLALVSTTAVAVSALITVFRTLKLIREDR